jgi:hypothetical protein
MAQIAVDPVTTMSSAIAKMSERLVTRRPSNSRSGSAGSSARRTTWRPRTCATIAGTAAMTTATTARADPLRLKMSTDAGVRLQGACPAGPSREARSRPVGGIAHAKIVLG